MDKHYDPEKIEQTWYDFWESNHYFAPKGDGTPYCIMIPPPNVTGSLHMGHGFQNTLMDALIRYHRMCGNHTFWQGGTDHAGIATQMVVERQLAQQGQSRTDLGRDAFVKKIWDWKAHSGSRISEQLRRLGSSIDWTRERFTMDDALSRAVNKVFITLYDEGLIYRGKRLVNWDPKFQTAISDLEVVPTEETGALWHIRYPLEDGSGHLTVATTRPETLLGDVAVAVHPEDERYKTFIGKQVRLPLTDRTIPVIADEYVDPEFGTGCLKITPAHDFNDYEVGKRHGFDPINILNPDATLNNNAPAAYQGLDRFKAREQVLEALETQQLLEKTEPHQLTVPRGDRSGVVIEPYLTDQWYVNMAPLAEPAIDCVKQGRVRFVPENWTKTYFQWLENIEDWCISRQLWWGHRIPAWYDPEGNVYVGDNEKAVREKYQLDADLPLTQDHDVLDTWFSSALWPFSTLGWPEDTDTLKQFYPTNVLVTGFDIIFFWVARMIMMGLKFVGEVPFHEVYITGLIRDAHGNKMSKSKGNILDPLDLIDGISLPDLIQKRTQNLMQPEMAAAIEKQTREEFPEGIDAHGTDPVRFTFCMLASTGRDIRYDIQRLAGYRNFCNKLWNAARYVLMNVEDKGLDFNAPAEFSIADRWITARLQTVIQQTHEHYKHYRFDLLAKTLYDFVWREYCDWYLELSKPILYGDDFDATLKQGARQTLITVLETVLRLLHPLMPFITEEIWQRVAPLTNNESPSLMLQAYPEAQASSIDEDAIAAITWLQEIITGIRTIRAEMNIPPSKAVPVLFHKGSAADQALLQQYGTYLEKLAKLSDITWLTPDEKVPAAAMALAGQLEILIPMAGLIDLDAEKARLEKEMGKLSQALTRTETKLANSKFTANAPEAVVAKTKAEHEKLQTALTQLKAQYEKIADTQNV